jgi:hypothetical protein
VYSLQCNGVREIHVCFFYTSSDDRKKPSTVSLPKDWCFRYMNIVTSGFSQTCEYHSDTKLSPGTPRYVQIGDSATSDLQAVTHPRCGPGIGDQKHHVVALTSPLLLGMSSQAVPGRTSTLHHQSKLCKPEATLSLAHMGLSNRKA